MATGLDFTGMVPGIDFLQSLVKSASAAAPVIPGLGGVPGMGQWVMPTLDPAELEKRISELRTVLFWLQQNAKLLEGTIQAMEVQRMTLSTLHSLNLPMADLRDALSIKTPSPSPSPSPSPRPEPEPEPASEPQAQAQPESAPAAMPPVDPMKWWGALTQQFTEIAGQAMRASAAETAADASAAGLRAPSAAAQAQNSGKRPPRKTAKKATRTAAAKNKPAVKARTR